MSTVLRRIFRSKSSSGYNRQYTGRFHSVFLKENWRNPLEKKTFLDSFRLLPNFVTPEEESSLFSEVEPYLRRLVYEKDHWDDAIVNFRETERKHWKRNNNAVIERIQKEAFTEEDRLRPYIHVLDLASEGLIKPHVDSVKFCGSTIAVLSLLSDSVARFAPENDPSRFVDVILSRRSLYILTGSSRYDYTHEILSREESLPVIKERRISIICRNEAE